MIDNCTCGTCFLWHEKKKYCSLDGKVHTGCIANHMPKGDKEPNIGEGKL